jgi:hypothetical protein
MGSFGKIAYPFRLRGTHASQPILSALQAATNEYQNEGRRREFRAQRADLRDLSVCVVNCSFLGVSAVQGCAPGTVSLSPDGR